MYSEVVSAYYFDVIFINGVFYIEKINQKQLLSGANTVFRFNKLIDLCSKLFLWACKKNHQNDEFRLRAKRERETV